jgi:hypothetical protein
VLPGGALSDYHGDPAFLSRLDPVPPSHVSKNEWARVHVLSSRA